MTTSPYYRPRQYQPAIVPSMTAADPALPVVVVGAGPVGMGVALGLAHRGIPVTVLEAATGVSFGSDLVAMRSQWSPCMCDSRIPSSAGSCVGCRAGSVSRLLRRP